jgi:hypothetical protein
LIFPFSLFFWLLENQEENSTGALLFLQQQSLEKHAFAHQRN